MGNCLQPQGPVEPEPKNGVEQSNGKNKSSRSSGSIHENMLRNQKNIDVTKKYETVKVLGTGSMGFVAKVKIRPESVGGSATNPKQKTGIFGSGKNQTTTTLSERRGVDVCYALKSIIVDRVSPGFLEELRNEIDILKSLVCNPFVIRRSLLCVGESFVLL
jgi:serine/threonine protein kinase